MGTKNELLERLHIIKAEAEEMKLYAVAILISRAIAHVPDDPDTIDTSDQK